MFCACHVTDRFQARGQIRVFLVLHITVFVVLLEQSELSYDLFDVASFPLDARKRVTSVSVRRVARDSCFAGSYRPLSTAELFQNAGFPTEKFRNDLVLAPEFDSPIK